MNLHQLFFIIIVFYLIQGCKVQIPIMDIAVSPGSGDKSPLHIKNGDLVLAFEEAAIRGHVNVILINKSKKDLMVFHQYSREGWFNIEFILKDSKGNVYKIKNNDIVWNVLEPYFPSTLAPSEMFVRDCFIQGWEWTPTLPDGVHQFKVYAIYNGTPKNKNDDVKYNGNIFSGIVKSKEF